MSISEGVPAIQVEKVSRTFARHAGQLLLRDRLRYLLSGGGRESFHALTDVSFTVRHGESVAIIGHNGAGKSTLLNLITGVCKPSAGRISINGRVAALLELGSGFHPDLTGAENARINASLLGLSRQETRERFERIVEFSGISDFIGEPLRTYSQGMIMRLAFSVAVHVDPDVLIIDEVIGVGDQAFFAKCVDYITSFRRAGKTLLTVSHSLDTVMDLCERAVWLDHGRVMRDGDIRSVIEDYTASVHRVEAAK
jgi:ABC-type polysaccharide/polyol phosphate transport system ATPase subunit